MKTSHTFIALFTILGVIFFFYFKNYFFTKRDFVIYHSPKFDICFMVDEGYSIDEITETSLTYSGKKNKGLLEVLKRDLDPNLKAERLNGFDGGYLKRKNLRQFEYKLNNEYILRDSFLFASKMPLNLVPFREQCSKILKHYKNKIEIFN